MADLFSNLQPIKQALAPGITLLKGRASDMDFLPHIQRIIQQAPLRHMMTPMGHASQVAMSNCGHLGWVSDQQGYRYSTTDPLTNTPWPQMPQDWFAFAQEIAKEVGIDHFAPDACLINQYKMGVAMGKHQDIDETGFNWPIISVSLGLKAVFQVSGKTRTGKNLNIILEDMDVLVLHGPARRYYHGVQAIKADPLQPNLIHRFNLTFRKAR